MLDLRFILENKQLIIENARNRNVKIDYDLIESLAKKRNQLIKEVDNLRHQINLNTAEFKKEKDEKKGENFIIKGQSLKSDLKEKEKNLRQVEQMLDEELEKIPNISHPDAPVGQDENSNQEVKKVGEMPVFEFIPRDHLELNKKLDIIDFESATRVAGNKFYYLKNEGVLLELALIQYAFEILRQEGFIIYSTPDIATIDVIKGLGFNPRGEETQIYKLEDFDLGLIATAEITLGGLYKEKIINKELLPLKLGGLSHCFRTEAGSYGKASKGLYRVHQFTKVEMFIYSKPEESDKMLDYIVSIEEKIFKGLKIPFRVVDCCTGELGAAAYRKYDLEAWFPGESRWGEITSASNCTDFQSRRLNIKYLGREHKDKGFVHTLNGTAIAISRAIIAILENYQQADGSVMIPQVLRKYTDIDRISPK